MALQSLVAAFGGRRVVFALGAAFVALAVVNPVALAADGTAPASVLIQFVLVGGPGFVLLVGAHRLGRSDVDPDFYPVVGRDALAGPMVLAVLIVVYDLQPTGGIEHPEAAVPILLALGSVAGFAAGVHDARARTQTRVLRERNRELRRTRRELEATVEELEASNERLEQFASAVSHDLQEPLRNVGSYLELLERRHAPELDEEASEFVASAAVGAERMHEMIDGLLSYARVESEGDLLQPVDLEAVLAAVLDDLEVRLAQADAEVTVEDLPTVRGDERQLRQVFQNLLDNAVEYSGDEPPRVEVFTADVAPPSTAEPDDLVTVAVRDEGIGMDPDAAERAFEVFQRLHDEDEGEGTGIGLALVDRIVDRHDGDVWVASEPGEGSTFYVALPVAGGDPIDELEAASGGCDGDADDGALHDDARDGGGESRRPATDAGD